MESSSGSNDVGGNARALFTKKLTFVDLQNKWLLLDRGVVDALLLPLLRPSERAILETYGRPIYINMLDGITRRNYNVEMTNYDPHYQVDGVGPWFDHINADVGKEIVVGWFNGGLHVLYQISCPDCQP